MDQQLKVGVVLEGDQLLGRAVVFDGDLIQPVLDGVDRELAVVAIGLTAEAAMRGRANPGIDLSGGGDALGFIQEALARVLDRFLDQVGREPG